MRYLIALILCVNVAFAQCPNGTYVDILITPDQYPQETSWAILNDSGDTVITGGPYTNIIDYSPQNTQLCIPNGDYTFEIYDTYGDGMAGSLWGGNDGSYSITHCGDVIVESDTANFGFYTFHGFTINDCAPPPPVYGCMNPNFVEFLPIATIDTGMCLTEKVFGCTDEEAFNYNEEANTDILVETCTYSLTLTDLAGNGWAGAYVLVFQGDEFLGNFTLEDGFEETFTFELNAFEPVGIKFEITQQSQFTSVQCGYSLYSDEDVTINEPGGFASPLVPFEINYGLPYCGDNCIDRIYGCTDINALNYNEEANTDDETCYYILGCTNPVYLEYDEEADFDDGSCETIVVLGCMDEDALNYDSEANVELEGSCIAVVEGCMNELAFNYNPNANVPDTCIAVVDGCIDETAMNYDSLANVSDNSCEYYIYGCTDSEAFNFNPLANTNDGSCVAIVYGCTDNAMFNYNSAANVENGSCIPFYYGCTDPTMYNYDDDANTDNGSCIPFIYGCTDSEAINYNVLANTDDNSCIDPILGCTDLLAFNYNAFANTDDGSCIDVLYGCIDPTQFNYNPEANTDDGSCIEFLYGCTDPTAFNYCDTCNTDNGSCIEIINGCTDTTALNYNPLANTNNNSCIYPLPGCTDPTAINYNIEANVPDSSCQYSAGCNVGDIYTLPNECFTWVIEVDPYCCDSEWDNSCVDLYQYCVDGWSGPVSIEELTRDLTIFPNPASDIISISKQVNLKIFNYTGSLVFNKDNVNTLNISSLEKGVYLILTEHNGRLKTTKLIKK